MIENWKKDYQEKKDEINIDITKASTKESTKESTQKRSMEIVEDSLTGKFSAYQSAHFSDSVFWNVYAVDFSWKMIEKLNIIWLSNDSLMIYWLW